MKKEKVLVTESLKDNKKTKKHSFIYYFLNVLLWLFIGSAFVFGGIQVIDKTSGYSFLETHTAVVVSDSMSNVNPSNYSYLNIDVKHIEKGDIIQAKEYKTFEDVQILDVVIYKGENGTLICHRVIEKYQSEGKNWVITRGDANNASDSPVVFESIRGKVNTTLKKIGYVIIFAQSPYFLLAVAGSAFFILLGSLLSEINTEKKNKNSVSKDEKDNPKKETKSTAKSVLPLLLLGIIVPLGGYNISNALLISKSDDISFAIEAAHIHSYDSSTHYCVCGELDNAYRAVTFVVNYGTSMGQNLYLAHGGINNSTWTETTFVAMSWTEGNNWTVKMVEPVNSTMLFKFVVKQDGQSDIWENGSNRSFTFITTGTQNCNWQA